MLELVSRHEEEGLSIVSRKPVKIIASFVLPKAKEKHVDAENLQVPDTVLMYGLVREQRASLGENFSSCNPPDL
jgi:hypothetical protein